MSSERLRSHAHLLLTHLLWMNWRSLLHVGSRQHRFLVFCLLVGMAKCHRAGGNWRSEDTEIFERNIEVFFQKKANLRRKITHSDVLAMFDAPYFVDADIAAGEAVAVVAVQSHIVVLDVFRRKMSSMLKLIKIQYLPSRLTFNRCIVISLANINPCVRVDEYLQKKHILLFQSLTTGSHSQILTIIVSRQAARKLATSISTKPNNPPSQSPFVATR